jgi:ABC-type uncharacterized transport system involved in gliding motility auxiliary subunit
MKVLRIIVGLAAIIMFGVALNLLAVRRDLFDATVVTTGAIAVIAAILWLVLTVVLMAGSTVRRRNLAGLSSLLGSLIFLAICIVLYAMALRWDQSWDLTQEGRQELAPQTIQVLENLDDDVLVLGLFITNTGAGELDVAREKTQRFLERCQQFTPHLKVEFIDPQQELARLKAMNLTFADPQGTVVIRKVTEDANPPQRTIPFTGPQPRLEERDFTNALINVVQDTKPAIGFLIGHGEKDITKPECANMKQFLESEGYAVKSAVINVADGTISGDFAILAINGLGANQGAGAVYSPREIEALDVFVNEGGRLFILLDPQYASARRPLFEWLEKRFGIVVGEDLLISGVNERLGEVSLVPDSAVPTVFQSKDLPDTMEFHGCFSSDNPITRNFDKRIDLLAARSVSIAEDKPANVTAHRILRTLPYTWAEKDMALLAEGKQPVQDDDELLGSYGVAVAASMKTDRPIGDTGHTRDACAVVIGDSDFLSNETILNGGNLNLMLNTMAWLSAREELIAIRPRVAENLPIGLSDADERRIAWISTLGVLHLVVIAGVVVFLFRRKYQ